MSVTTKERKMAARLARKYRRTRSWSQTQLAAHLETHQPTISEVERAYPSAPAAIVKAVLQLAA